MFNLPEKMMEMNDNIDDYTHENYQRCCSCTRLEKSKLNETHGASKTTKSSATISQKRNALSKTIFLHRNLPKSLVFHTPFIVAEMELKKGIRKLNIQHGSR